MLGLLGARDYGDLPAVEIDVTPAQSHHFAAPHTAASIPFPKLSTDVFDFNASPAWTYSAVASTVLQSTNQATETPGGLDGAPFARGAVVRPKHSAKYWAKATAGFDFSDADRVPPDRFNRVLWKGLKGGKPYPASLRGHRVAMNRGGDRD